MECASPDEGADQVKHPALSAAVEAGGSLCGLMLHMDADDAQKPIERFFDDAPRRGARPPFHWRIVQWSDRKYSIFWRISRAREPTPG